MAGEGKGKVDDNGDVGLRSGNRKRTTTSVYDEEEKDDVGASEDNNVQVQDCSCSDEDGLENGEIIKKKEGDSCFTLIDGDGALNVASLDHFLKKLDCGLPYAVVSIMGPQGSGRSTLLNHLFKTNFKEMDASKGRYQTTKGIWMSCCAKFAPFTFVMDLEGTGSREQKGDTAFEKQSALFAFVVSDIVLINMWCHDLGRHQAANRPLLKTVFQYMLRLFRPRKTTLMFVIRDPTKTPLKKLESDLKEDIEKIWASVPKPEDHKLTPLSEFFDVHVDALSSYEERNELFIKEVAVLREKCLQSMVSIVKSGSVFSSNVSKIWKAIKENKHLPKAQPIKAMSNLKKIAGLNLTANKIDLMEVSKFYCLSRVTKKREISGTLILALCKKYDCNKKGFQLNENTFFGFCTQEVAEILGMKDEGDIHQEHSDKKFPSYLKDLKPSFRAVMDSSKLNI